eukprot:scaffold3134_cov182-Amphora_coffeaeformis.AAC.17
MKSWHVFNLLNKLYKMMDYIAECFGIYKIETVGGCYICCSGLPRRDPNHAVNVANFTLAVQNALELVVSPVDNKPLQLRFGFHSGSCTAGVVVVTAPRHAALLFVW